MRSDDINDMNTCPPVCRRVHPRLIVDDTGEVLAENNQMQPIIVKDLSVRGAKIIGEFPLSVGQKIAIDIRSGILLEPSIRKEAQVRWANKIDKNLWAIGLNFDENNVITFPK